MDGPIHTAEQKLDRIARAQHGVATRHQLLRACVTDEQIQRRLHNGALIRVHRGVYRVGHKAPSTDARYMAAVLAFGEGALLCGPAAGHLHRILKGPPPAPEVIAPSQRRVPGVIARRARRIDARDATSLHGIPITTVPRTLVDLAATLSPSALARACHEAGVLHRTTPKQVEAVLNRRPNSPGATKLGSILRGEQRATLSALERRFLERLAEANLPLPITNRPAGAHRVDCRWPDQRLTVELDSYRFHNSRHAWEQDRRREREAHRRGDEHRRYTYEDVFEDPRLMLQELRGLLGLPRRPSRAVASR